MHVAILVALQCPDNRANTRSVRSEHGSLRRRRRRRFNSIVVAFKLFWLYHKMIPLLSLSLVRSFLCLPSDPFAAIIVSFVHRAARNESIDEATDIIQWRSSTRFPFALTRRDADSSVCRLRSFARLSFGECAPAARPGQHSQMSIPMLRFRSHSHVHRHLFDAHRHAKCPSNMPVLTNVARHSCHLSESSADVHRLYNMCAHDGLWCTWQLKTKTQVPHVFATFEPNCNVFVWARISACKFCDTRMPSRIDETNFFGATQLPSKWSSLIWWNEFANHFRILDQFEVFCIVCGDAKQIADDAWCTANEQTLFVPRNFAYPNETS